jgi:hypothetical protein
MNSFILIVALILAIASPTIAQTQGVSTALLNRFIQMATICMSTYVGDLCLVPDGLLKVADINNSATDVYGWVLRDDAAQEITTSQTQIIHWRASTHILAARAVRFMVAITCCGLLYMRTFNPSSKTKLPCILTMGLSLLVTGKHTCSQKLITISAY